MKTPFVTIASFLALGAFVTYSTTRQSPAPARGWPPLPQNIINLTGTTSALTPGAAETIYTVPSDRWLIVTGIIWRDPTASFNPTFIGGLEQELGGIFVNKTSTGPNAQSLIGNNATLSNAALAGTPPAPFHASAVGFTFAPGSKVNIRSSSSINTETIEYNIVGYLAQ